MIFEASNESILASSRWSIKALAAFLIALSGQVMSDNTVIVHTSDHGDTLGAHQLFGKEVIFEEAVRVPYLVRAPRTSTQTHFAVSQSH